MTEKEIADSFKNASVPAIQLIAVQTGEQSVSKIGGLPDVPQHFEWPIWKGKPLAFIAQIDLSTIHSTLLAGLPRTGVLYFFYDQEQSTWGFDPADRGSWRVVYWPDSRELTQAIPPDGLRVVYDEKRVDPRHIHSFPSLERLGFSLSTVTDEILDVEDRLRTQATQDDPEHQIGGFPNPIQDDEMELECQLVSNGLYCGDSSGYQDPRRSELAKGASQWELLLQIDTDDDTGMMWGDGGRLYFWIRASDLAAEDFSNVWMVLQCG